MEINCQMEELIRQLSASQQKVEELTKNNGDLIAELQQQNGNLVELQQQNGNLIVKLQQQKQDFEVY
jgi:polyribonucleotide nucleotidyltransferase